MKLYYLVIDFEATCSESNAKDHEIIEFPALLVNTRTGDIISEFRHFVKPLTHTKISDFIKNLTHITDDDIKTGLTWEECLKEFEAWCKSYGVTSDNTTIVTCGDWDFLTMFIKQNRAANIDIYQNKYLYNLTSQWSNLKIHYKIHTNTYSQIDLPDMLHYFNLELIGHHHSGIDDCKNIQKICHEMILLNIDITETTRTIYRKKFLTKKRHININGHNMYRNRSNLYNNFFYSK